MNDGRRTPDRAPASHDPFDSLLERVAKLSPVPTSVAARLHPGRALLDGRFQLVRQIGVGGMGIVYDAIDRERSGRVAIKTLSRLDAAGIYRLKNEFRGLAEVVHPNLVRLYELFFEDGAWCFSMELVAGEPFDRYVRPRGELDEPRLRATLGQLLAGVHAIHEAGKIHRDLKPSNVLVTDEGRVVILDFGLLAAVEAGGEGQTLDEERRSGTPAYMAPEQAAGKSSSAASDYYAVGVMLFEVLTSRLPFAGERFDLLERKQSEVARRARAVEPRVPADLDALCAALLDRDPSARPAWHALEAFARERTSATPPQKPAPALTGRDSELSMLWRAFESAERGRATLVHVRGASGIGKSALVAAFLERLRAENGLRVVLLSGRCYGRQAVPYRAFDRVIDELTHALRRMPPTESAALMPRDVAALCRIFPVLGHVEAAANAPERPAANEHELRLRAFDAFVELLARLRDRRGLVVHIDDLHWLDEDSVLLLEHLLAQEDPPPILLVLAERDAGAQGEAPEAVAREAALLARVQRAAESNAALSRHVIELGPLTRAATQELAQSLLEGVHDAERLASAIAHEAEGNAFLASELSRHVARKRAAGSTSEYPGAAQPVSLEQAIEARVAPLGEGARRMLELLAVSARPVRGEVLVRAAREHAESAQLALDALCAAQLIRDGGGHVYECAHDRVRTAVSAPLPATALRDHNAQLAAAWSERSDADPATLFELYLAAGDRAQAGRYALEAAERAGAALGFERHARLLGHAIELLPRAETEQLALRARRAEALSNAGQWAQAAEAFDVARAEAERAGDGARGMRLAHDAALHFLGSGHGALGLPRLREVLEQSGLRWPERFVLSRAALRLLSLWALFGGRALDPPAPQAAAAPLSKNAERLERLFECAALVPPYDLLRGLYFMAAFVGRALRAPSDHPDSPALVSIAQAMLACMLATPLLTRRFARRLCERAIERARAQPKAHLASAALSLAGFTRMQQGALDAALALGQEALTRLGDAQRAHVYEAWNARSVQALALVTMGRLGEAAACFADNARLAREVGDGLARSGGDSALRHLVAHDLPQAHALIAHKRAVLAETDSYGVLHEVARNERLLCALYEGRGGEALDQGEARSPLPLLFFDVSMLAACCALQAVSSAPPAERERARARAVKSARRCLRGLPRSTEAGRASAAQLRAALLMLDGDASAAAAFARVAGREYEAAGMRLHAAIMRLREAELRGDEPAAQAAKKFMSEQGVARPEAWARMLAPGFER